VRAEAHSLGEDSVGHVHRRHVGGWIVAVTLLVASSVVGWGAVRPYLFRHSAPVGSSMDGRVARLLDDGERALIDGDVDVAEEAFDKASALAEHDVRVLRDQSRLASLKGDVPWLGLKLLAQSASAEQRTATAQLESNVARAKRTASEAYSLAPDDPANACALIDALRLEGVPGAARSVVSKVMTRSGDREVAYVLAALDLTEPEPMWSTVIERLRLSAASDVQAGRARAALVYALGRSGDRAGAATELGKLDVAKRPYPLLPALHKWLEGLAAPPFASVAHSAARNPSGPSPSVPSPPPRADMPAAEGMSLDAGSALQAAAVALRTGAYARAAQIYRALVARNDRDSEALSGLGDVAHAQGDIGGAMAAYRRAIMVNPSYLPALVGLADAEWAAGDRAKAQRAYENVVDHFPEGTYPEYVKERAAETPALAPSGTDSVLQHGPSEEGRDPPAKPSATDDDR
jgi:TolA-binding protein